MFTIFLTQNNSFILGPISKLLGYVLEFIYKLLANAGIENVALCIIIFTILINAILIPFNYKSQKSTRLTQLISPELNKITEKYKGKRDDASLRAQQAEQQALYDKYGISPASGCLPLLITMPILFAMYRVLYAIPAYISPVKELYSAIAERIIATPGYFQILKDTFSSSVSVTSFRWTSADLTALTENQTIDLLAKFSADQWTTLATQFPALSGIIAENAAKILKINSFLTMDITQSAGFHFPQIIIPILAGFTQWLSQKTMTSRQVEQKSESEALNTMNNSMKYMWIISAVICFSLPVGVGLYWIVGAVFRIIQQLIINAHMDKMDVNEIIEQNREKAEAKRAKRQKRDENVEKYSQANTRSIENKNTISNYAKGSNAAKPAKDAKNDGAKDTKKDSSESKQEKSKDAKNAAAASGSIAAIAHMLDRE